MALKQLTGPEFLAGFDPENHAALKEAACLPGTEALVRFENVQFDSSAFGAATALAVGPERTRKSVVACEGQHLNDLPSQRQYAVAYVSVADLLVTSYSGQVRVLGETEFVGNQLRFATEAEAKASVTELASRWLSVEDTRVIPTSDPVTHRFENGKAVSLEATNV